ncbi:hypothetical protein [Terrisporobacter hibernicus]|uniref:Uncharacterized protein n=1 Tax=Terrisporobacter hibernicus TaxID=2813371 RepID=A0AAX2ZFF2_9FIRM|nr:hypothetical protein [Terrisporobacter hibernicus]UEL47561.1 hypothetical protein JW646_18370 [Terrisporobacter hibernicus]
MLFNRAYINELKSENEKLKRQKEEYAYEMIKSMDSRDSYKKANIKLINDIGNLKKDIESKENSVCNLLEANKELSLSNNYLENKIKLLEQVIKQHEENECELNTELCKYKGIVDKIDNCTRMVEGRGINE